jgi:hypothetical protein
MRADLYVIKWAVTKKLFLGFSSSLCSEQIKFLKILTYY